MEGGVPNRGISRTTDIAIAAHLGLDARQGKPHPRSCRVTLHHEGMSLVDVWHDQG